MKAALYSSGWEYKLPLFTCLEKRHERQKEMEIPFSPLSTFCGTFLIKDRVGDKAIRPRNLSLSWHHCLHLYLFILQTVDALSLLCVGGLLQLGVTGFLLRRRALLCSSWVLGSAVASQSSPAVVCGLSYLWHTESQLPDQDRTTALALEGGCLTAGSPGRSLDVIF